MMSKHVVWSFVWSVGIWSMAVCLQGYGQQRPASADGPVIAPAATPMQDAIRTHLDMLQRTGDASLRGRRGALYAENLLVAYYETHAFSPLWVTDSGPRMRLFRLQAALRATHRDGLTPADCRTTALRQAMQAARTATHLETRRQRLAEVELRATDAFLLYSLHLLNGRVDPVQLVPSWNIAPRRADLTAVLDAVRGGRSVDEALAGLRPAHPEYAALQQALRRYRAHANAGGWGAIPPGPALAQGDAGPRVAALRDRLAMTDGLAPVSDTQRTVFDAPLHDAVVAFQARHGLTADGVVGTQTQQALNVSADERITQIQVNLERWRWLPDDLGARYVLVNIAAFELAVVEAGREVLTMRVVAGRPYRQTPVFSDAISYLVLSPYWHVPHSIATRDKLPDFQRDPSLVVRQGFEVFDSWEAGASPVDPMAVAWDSLTASSFPYRLRQRPGPSNALGRVKFMFPNPHNVYLHDTPTRHTFARATRDFSSGCIRLEDPLALAAYLLRDAPGWTPERIAEQARQDSETTVVLPEAVPVHLLYWTAWAEADGTVHFRSDVYDRDAAVAAAMNQAPERFDQACIAGDAPEEPSGAEAADDAEGDNAPAR